MGFGFAEILPVHDDGGAELLAITHLDQRREFRHDDGGGDAEQFALIGEGLGVIAGGGGDDAALFLLGRQLGEGVGGAAFFETSGALEVVELAVDLHPGQLAQRDGVRTGGVVDGVLDAIARGLDVLERGHAHCIYRVRARAATLFVRSAGGIASYNRASSSASRILKASCSGSKGLGRKNIPSSARSAGRIDSSR